MSAIGDLFGMNRQEWQDRAACRDCENPDIFFAETPGSHRSTFEAKAICAGCPVWQECLDYAVARNEPYGVWGGMAPTGRALIRRGLPRPNVCPRGHNRGEVGTRPDGSCRECRREAQRVYDRDRRVRKSRAKGIA